MSEETHVSPVGNQVGETMTPNAPRTTGRAEFEALTTGAEENNIKDNVDVLAEYAQRAGNSRDFNVKLIEHLFDHGKPGQYASRTTTLIEKVASALPPELKDRA